VGDAADFDDERLARTDRGPFAQGSAGEDRASLTCRRATCSAMRALTPLPVGLRSIWRPAKMQTLRLGETWPSVSMVP
jgi:hypothetical protein